MTFTYLVTATYVKNEETRENEIAITLGMPCDSNDVFLRYLFMGIGVDPKDITITNVTLKSINTVAGGGLKKKDKDKKDVKPNVE